MKREHTSQSILPSGYRQLEYIESTGTQYILTNITGASNLWKWYFKTWSDFTIHPYQILHGLYYVSGTGRILGALREGVYWDWVCNTGYNRITVNNFNSVWTETFEDSNSVTINGTIYSITKNTNTRNERVTLLGSIYSSASAGQYFGCGKYAKCTIWDENDNMIFDGYPALRTADSKPGLYDLANNQFYTNAGTGEFLYA